MTKVDIVEEALNEMKSLSVSEQEILKVYSDKQYVKILRRRILEDTKEEIYDMDLDSNKKRKKE